MPRKFVMPDAAVDTHAHVIGAPPEYPYAEGRGYIPTPASVDSFIHMLDRVGVSYAVLVQVSVHGTDNSLLIETLQQYPNRFRGVGVAPPDLPEREWARMDEAGICGLRLNTISGAGIGLGELERYEAVCAELNWHLQILTDPQTLAELSPRLTKVKVPLVLDHMGHSLASQGAERIDSPHAQCILGLLQDGAWLKLSGAFRISADEQMADTVPIARAFLEVAPDRCVWGSDWPHVAFWKRMPNVGDLLDLLFDWAPDEKLRNAVLTTNAHKLYGFRS